MNSRVITATAVAVLASVLSVSAQEAVAPPQAAGEAREKAYTAQRRPRVGVMDFDNTNELANKEKYGASVSAMLVTFLKRKSQLVVVERQKDSFGRLLEQWRMRSSGVTAAPPVDPTQPPATPPTAPPTFAAPVTVQSPGIEDIDAILEGRVTVFGNTETRPDGSTRIVNMEVEIDARLIAPDAHIISAGHQRGPANCLRQTVESLGIELEQGFLRPYYGNLNVAVDTPSNVRIYLTPVLRDGARDDERPPVELDQTVSPQASGGRNEYDRWVTTPRVATISNILVGWYTIRIDRPGFVGMNTENARIMIDASGQPVQASSRAPVTKEQERFLVQIKPFETAKWPKDEIPIRLDKRWGTLALKVKREFLDNDFVDASKVEGFKSYVAALGLDMNRTDDVETAKPLDPSTQGGACGDTTSLKRKNLERVTACVFKVAQESFDTYRGGPLMVEDYQAIPAGDGRRLPVGAYEMVAVAPGYEFTKASEFDVAHGVRDRDVFVELRRMRGQITVSRAGDPEPNYRLYFEGRETKHKHSIPLDFTGPKTIRDMPVDSYTVYTDKPGMAKWRRRLELQADSLQAKSSTETCVVTTEKPPAVTFAFDLKTQPWLAGRLGTMNQFVSPNVSRRADISALLDRVIVNEEQRKPDPKRPAAASQQLLVGGSGASSGEKEAARLLDDLRYYLREVDLLYLDDNDVRRILGVPAVAGIVREYVENGGAIFAFVSTQADYASIFGASINIDTKRETRDEMEMRQGDVPTVVMDLKLEFPLKREFPSIRTSNKEPLGDWRVVSYRKKGRKEPIVLERGNLESGGYVLVWVDTFAQLPDHQLTKQAVSAAEKRALAWSQFLMYRRLGPESPERRDAESKLQTLRFDAVGEAKILAPKTP